MTHILLFVTRSTWSRCDLTLQYSPLIGWAGVTWPGYSLLIGQDRLTGADLADWSPVSWSVSQKHQTLKHVRASTLFPDHISYKLIFSGSDSQRWWRQWQPTLPTTTPTWCPWCQPLTRPMLFLMLQLLLWEDLTMLMRTCWATRKLPGTVHQDVFRWQIIITYHLQVLDQLWGIPASHWIFPDCVDDW